MSNERTIYWLATVGSGTVPGIGKMDAKMKNPGGEMYWKDLVALADSKVSDSTRATAIQALGLVRESQLRKPIEHWLSDTAPAIRASATLLLADFPGPESRKWLTTMAADTSPGVRSCVARAIGFSHDAMLADILAKLLDDVGTKKYARQPP